MSTNEGDEKSISDKLAQLADKRREAARLGLEHSKVPEFVREIIQTEIQFVISPRLLPYEQADLGALEASLKTLYGLSRQTPDMSRYADPMALLRDETPDSALVFKNGRFKISAHDFVAIKALRMTYEGVHLILTGPSSVADTVVPDVVEQLWASAGVAKPWKEIEPFIQLKAFGCGTLVDLGFPLHDLLSKELRTLLDTDFVAGKRFAHAMAPTNAIDKFTTPDRLVASYVVDDINLLFNIFDPQSGRANQLKLRLSVGARHAYGSSHCEVISELPFEKHIEAVKALREKFLP